LQVPVDGCFRGRNMGSLIDDTSVVAEGNGFSACLSSDWGLWGPNGGYLASIAMRAVGASVPTGHRPVSFSCQYLASPLFSRVDLLVTAVRRGRRAWCLAVEMRQEEKLCLLAQAWTTDCDGGPQKVDVAMPAVPPPALLQSSKTYVPAEFRDCGFWQHFDSRQVDRNPVAAPAPARLLTWQRFVDLNPAGDPFVEAMRLLVLLDTMPWPTFCHGLGDVPPYVAPSLDLAVWFHKPASGAEWMLVESSTEIATGGLIHGSGLVWNSAGDLIASGGGQLLVIDRSG